MIAKRFLILILTLVIASTTLVSAGTQNAEFNFAAGKNDNEGTLIDTNEIQEVLTRLLSHIEL